MKILIATDGSAYGDAAVRATGERPWPPGSQLRVIAVMEKPAIAYTSDNNIESEMRYLESKARITNKYIATKAANSLCNKDRVVTHVVREGITAEEIIKEAKEWGADLIMIGTHNHRGIARFLLGSVAKRSDEIVTEATEWSANHILIGSHSRRGVSRFLLGSVAENVALYAPCSVEIVRENVTSPNEILAMDRYDSVAVKD
ncbi:MAG: universal stress protein [Acidobacteriota bacterium]